MLTKEKCEKALDKIARYCSDYRLCMFPQRFKLNGELELLDKLINEHFNPQQYEFEDLHKGMWVWDDKEKECLYIIKTFISTSGFNVFTYLGIYQNLEELKN